MNELLVVDGTGFYYRNFFALRNLKKDGISVGGLYGYLRNIWSKMESLGKTWSDTIHCFDTKSSRAKRSTIYKEYKAQRAKMTEVGFFECMQDLKEVLTGLGAVVLQSDNLEADDIIAILVKRNPTINIIVLSDDADLWQLTEYSNVKILTSKGLVTKESMLSQYGLYGREWLYVKCLMGDPSDNLMPVEPGIGIKTAIRIVLEGKLEAYRHSDIFKQNYELMNLLDIDDSEITLSLEPPPRDPNKVLTILQKYNMKSLFKLALI